MSKTYVQYGATQLRSKELNARQIEDPNGGKIDRDDLGRVSELRSEAAAIMVVGHHISSMVFLENRIEALREDGRVHSHARYVRWWNWLWMRTHWRDLNCCGHRKGLLLELQLIDLSTFQMM